MTPSGQNFVFVITAHNVRPFLPPLVASLAGQRCHSWQAVFVDDASTDGTLETLRSLLDAHELAPKFQIVENQVRRGKAFNAFHAVSGRGAADDVMVMLDADDYLANDDALDRLAREYDQGWEVVWSNWRGTDGSRGSSGHLHPFLSPRRQPFVSSHLFTFRRRLLAAVTESDLQDDAGQWFAAGCDLAIAWPILDQTIKRKHIEEVLLVYNRGNPLSHDQSGPRVRPLVSKSQAETAAALSRRSGKPLIVDNEFLHAHLYELLQAAAYSQRLATRQQIAAAVASLQRSATPAPSTGKPSPGKAAT
jgi:glycosyltransferase involved in cell wall biosynthesis